MSNIMKKIPYNKAMEITFYNRTNLDLDSYETLYKKVAASAEKRLHLKNQCISVTFVRSVTIHKINRDYRGIDRPTDVISFAVNDNDTGFELEEETEDLGDLFINVDYARKQAKEYGHSMEREMAFLFTHGLLHCLGYDHMKPEEEKVMFGLQKEILNPIIQRKLC